MFSLQTDLNPLSTDPDYANQLCKTVAWHTFAAKLTASGVPELSFIQYAGRWLWIGLETVPWEIYHIKDVDLEPEYDEDEEYVERARLKAVERHDIRILNIRVPELAPWIQFVGRQIYEMEGEILYENFKATTWTGPKGWSKVRFAYWRERFEWISKVTALDRETRRLARDSVVIMQKIERGDNTATRPRSRGNFI